MNNKEIWDSLNDETKNGIIREYDAGKESVKAILHRYGIDNIAPNQLSRLLPPVAMEDECPYCHVPMYKKRSRDVNTFRYNEIYCMSCGHKTDSFCKCENCINAAVKDTERKRNLISQHYPPSSSTVELTDLGFQEQWAVIYYLLITRNEPGYFIPSRVGYTYSNAILENLIFAGAITVSDQSPIYAFEDCEDFPDIYYINRVYYNINIVHMEMPITHPELLNWDWIDDAEKIAMLQELIIKDIIISFKNMLYKRHITLVTTPAQIDNIRLLSGFLSYSQIISLCHRVAVFYGDKVTTRKYSSYSAGKSALTSVNTFYRNSLENDWPVDNAPYIKPGSELKAYINYVCGKDINILEKYLDEETYNAADLFVRNIIHN